MTGLFDKFSSVARAHKAITQTGRDPFAVRIDRVFSPTEAEIGGRRCILLGSNNYLGLTFDQDAISAACEALSDYGTGTTGSRVANGSYAPHQDLEHALADYYGMRSAVLFTTGYQANLGFISAITGKDDILLIDSDCHASIYDGCKLSDATVIRFRHNDADDLARRLRRLPSETNKLVVIEGIYSMLGDRAPLAEIVEAAKAGGAYVLVDEAHSLGVLGETGRGLGEETGLQDQIDFVTGTFSKSVGTIGGFCLSNHPELESIRLAARSYLFTASLPPSVVASARVTLDRISDPRLRRNLWHNAERLYHGLKELGFEVGPEMTPIIGVRLTDAEKALAVWYALLENGVYVNLALPPATPQGACLLRCSVCAAHTDNQIDAILAAFGKARMQLTDETRATG